MTEPRWAYYNEIDTVAAEWLRRLIKADLIAPGEVDERDIRDVTPEQLSGFAQCHFFAGIGIWSGSLRAAGWPDARRIWTGSCPCQPFSAAGRGDGVDDERHLWPHWFWLISQCRPGVVVGEQVAGKDGLGWNDLVSADLDGAGYAFGSINLCAAGFGMDWGRSAYAQWLERAIHDCPDPLVARQIRNFADWARQSLAVGGLHIRQRQYFVGLADEPGGGWRERRDAALARAGGHPDGSGGPSSGLPDAEGSGGGTGLRDQGPAGQRRPVATDHSPDGGLVDGECARLEGLGGDGDGGDQSGRLGEIKARSVAPTSESGGVADANRDGAGHQSRGRMGEEETAHREVGDLSGQRLWSGLESPSRRMGDDRGGGCDSGLARDARSAESPRRECGDESDRSGRDGGAGEADGGWSPFDWLLCRDGVWRATESCPQSLFDEITSSVGPIRAPIQKAIEEEIDARWPAPDHATLLQTLCQGLAETALSEESPTRKPIAICQAAVLLTFVFQLAAQGWKITDRFPQPSAEAFAKAMRGMRLDEETGSPSCRSELAQQRPDEHSNALSELSRILAHHAETAWGNVAPSYAEAGFPLTREAANRVGRLRGYGNGLDFETATGFCEVVIELADEAGL